MTIFTPLKKVFNEDNWKVQKFLRREEKRVRRSSPTSSPEFSQEEERLKYEILRASL